MFVNHSSAAEICTTRAGINTTGKTNAAKRVENHYNEYCEFHAREVEAHKCTSFMEMIEMEKISGKTTFNWVVVTFGPNGTTLLPRYEGILNFLLKE